MIGAIILAAGESRRMRGIKMSLPFGNKTMIEILIDTVEASKVDSITVVLGAYSERIRALISKYPVEISVNPDFRRGMLSSVQVGIQSLSPKAEAVLVFLGDQPSIAVDTINQIIFAYRNAGKGILVPVYNERRGHPVLIDLKYRNDILCLGSKIGLRELLYTHPQDIHELETQDPGVLQDIDDNDDYKRELKIQAKRNKS